MNNKMDVISLYHELISLDDKDIEYAKGKTSFGKFKNDLELYIFVCDSLMNDLIQLEEYELCVEVKKLLNKLHSYVD